MKIIFVFYLPILILSASIEWKKTSHSHRSYGDQVMSLTSPDGTAHIFWMHTSNSYDYNLIYVKLLSNGSMTEERKLNMNHSTQIGLESMAGDISDDGKHVLLAYNAYREDNRGSCNKYDTKRCLEIFLTESFDGGDTWIDAVKMNRTDMNDTGHRFQPAMFLEKDTGKVYVAYNTEDNFTLCVRQPNAKHFDYEVRYTFDGRQMGKYLGQTIDKKTSKRYLHVVWKGYADTYKYVLKHIKTDDEGKTWSRTTVLAESVSYSIPSMVRIEKDGEIFAQYYKGIDIMVIWSMDQGESWEKPFRIGSDNSDNSAIAICGEGSKKRLFSFNGKLLFGNGFLRYLTPGERHFDNLKYPFATLKNIGCVHLSCRYISEGKYLVVPTLRESSNAVVYIAYGIATDL